MSDARPVRPNSPVSLRQADSVVVFLLCALLPAGFRERQRGEWTADLVTLAESTPGARWRYLLGAALTLPSLRRLVRHGQAHGTTQVTVPAGVANTVARVLLLGMIWPIVSFVLFVPLRYYAFDVPERVAQWGMVDPKSVWPMEGTPGWLLPLWAVLHLGAILTVIGGPLLLAAVGLLGGLTALLRRLHQPVHPPTVAVVALVAVVLGAIWTAFGDDRGYAAGALGATAVVLAATANLRRRTRAGLLILGGAAVAVLVWFNTDPGLAMRVWYLD